MALFPGQNNVEEMQPPHLCVKKEGDFKYHWKVINLNLLTFNKSAVLIFGVLFSLWLFTNIYFAG